MVKATQQHTGEWPWLQDQIPMRAFGYVTQTKCYTGGCKLCIPLPLHTQPESFSCDFWKGYSVSVKGSVRNVLSVNNEIRHNKFSCICVWSWLQLFIMYSWQAWRTDSEQGLRAHFKQGKLPLNSEELFCLWSFKLFLLKCWGLLFTAIVFDKCSSIYNLYADTHPKKQVRSLHKTRYASFKKLPVLQNAFISWNEIFINRWWLD